VAEAGRDVVLVEQGYHTNRLHPREDEMMPFYEDMGQRATVDQSILILQGKTSAARPCTTSATAYRLRRFSNGNGNGLRTWPRD
jgi:hypothetical protein